MKQTRVASRYAKSLIDLAQEKGELEAVFADMQLVNGTVHANPELRLMLDSPIVKADKKEKVLQAVFAGKISAMSLKFMDILVSKGRESLIDDVAEQVEAQYNLLKNIVKAEVVSVSALTANQRTEVLGIVAKLTGKADQKVELNEVIDPEIIGGFIVRVGDNQLDQSVSGKLEQYRQEFSKNNYIAEV